MYTDFLVGMFDMNHVKSILLTMQLGTLATVIVIIVMIFYYLFC